MKIYAHSLDSNGQIVRTEVTTRMGYVTFEHNGEVFEVSAGADNASIGVRLVESRKASAMAVEPHAANSITVRVRGE